MRFVLAAGFHLLSCSFAFAITGGAPPANGWSAQAIVMVVDKHGDLCTGTAIAPDLVLTAAHCVVHRRDDRVKIFQNGEIVAVRSHAIHPAFRMENYAAARATADLALLKLPSALPQLVTPAALAPSRRVAAGETLVIAGFGVSVEGTPRGIGVPRAATLTVTGKPGSLQIRLVDPLTDNKIGGLGACTGDSGGPVFEPGGPNVIGVVSWSTAANDEEGCGGLTGVTPLLNYRGWIVETAKKLGTKLEQ